MLKIGVMTPVDHIEGIPELIDSLGTRFDVPEYKTAARDYILKNEVNVLICNPNKQSFIIDEEFLEGTRVVVINSCSTGLNHIDIDYCKNCDFLYSDPEVLVWSNDPSAKVHHMLGTDDSFILSKYTKS